MLYRLLSANFVMGRRLSETASGISTAPTAPAAVTAHKKLLARLDALIINVSILTKCEHRQF